MFSRVGGRARKRAIVASSMSEPLVLMERMKPISVKRSYRGQKSGQRKGSPPVSSKYSIPDARACSARVSQRSSVMAGREWAATCAGVMRT